MRRAGNFADPRSDDDFWLLHHRFRASGKARRNRNPDPVVGWLRRDVTPETYLHPAAARLAGRRPILLYGDSYAQCVTPAEECWQGLLEASDFGAEHALINYGTAGYGLDQSVLLMQETLDQYQDLDPIVVLGILIDNDLDRSYLSVREWPKPRFRLTSDGALELEGPASGNEISARARSIGIRSYAWRWLLHGSGYLPDSVRDRCRRVSRVDEAKRRLNERLLDLAALEVEARELEFFVIAFHAYPSLRPEGNGWREEFLLAALEERGIPYVSSRPLLNVAGLPKPAGVKALFVQQGPTRNHYSRAGNQVVFHAFERGLGGHFDRRSTARIASFHRRRVEGSILNSEFVTRGERGPDSEAALEMELGVGTQLELAYTPGLDWSSFAARVRLDSPRGPEVGQVSMRWSAGDRLLSELELHSGTPAVPIKLDLSGQNELLLAIDYSRKNEGAVRLSFLAANLE